MLTLALRSLRYRSGTFVAAFLAMLGAATVLMACGGLVETGVRTAVPPTELRGADVVVAGDPAYRAPGGDPDEPAILPERVRVDADLAATLAGLPGVRETTTHVFEGSPPTGTVDAIGVVAEDGTDVDALRERVDAELGDGVETLVGDQRGQAELREARATGVDVVALAGVLTAFAVLVSVFGVASMLGLSIAQRQRELALLRAVGATPRQLRRLVLRETLVLSLVATGLAVLPGYLLGRFLFGLLTSRGIAAEGIAFHQGWVPTLASVGVAVLAALAGALGAGRRAARTRPTQALSEAALEGRLIGPWRLLLAAVFLAGGAALVFVTMTVMSGPLTPATGAPAVVVLAVGCALLSPVLTTVLTGVLQWPLRALGGTTGELAALNARGRAGRLAAVVSPVVLLTAVATGMLYLQTTNDTADRRAFTDALVADAVVTVPDGVTPDLVERIDAADGVAGASAYVSSTGFVVEPEDRSPGGEGSDLEGVSAAGAAATTPVRVTDGDLSDLTGDTVALSRDHADRLGVAVGDPLGVLLGDRTTHDLEVVALYDAPPDHDTLLLPVDTLAEHTTGGTAQRVLVRAADGVDPDRLVASLRGVADGASVGGREVLLDEYEEGRGTASFAIYLMVLMIAGYAAVTVVNTLASSTATRRRELGLQRLAGSTRAQVLRMVGVESALVAGIGLALGTGAALLVLVPVSLKRLGTVVPSGSPWLYAATVGTTVVVVAAATLLPAWRVTRGRPAQAALAVE